MAVTFDTGLSTRNATPMTTPRMMLRNAPRPTSSQLGPLAFFPLFALMDGPLLPGGFGRGCGGGWGCCCGGGARGLGLARALGGGGRLRLPPLGVRPRLVLVVGDVKPAPLEDEPGAAPDQPLERRLGAFRALLQRLVPHRLELLEMVTAL